MQPSANRESQAEQVLPPLPHWVELRAVTQLDPEQQPEAHPTPSQTQVPFTQCCPSAHGPAPPH